MWTGEKGRERTERALNDYVMLAGGVAAGVQCVIDMDHSRLSFALIRPIQTRTFSCSAMAGFVPWLCAAQSTLLSPLSPRTVFAAAAAVPPPGHCSRRPSSLGCASPRRSLVLASLPLSSTALSFVHQQCACIVERRVSRAVRYLQAQCKFMAL